MARTAVVNPRRRRRRRKSNPKRRSVKRRRNYGAALATREPNRRRSRRRYYGKKRRRNPGGGARLSRARNPALDLDSTIEIVPPATAGVWAARWAVAQAGEFEEGEPGIKHALAIWLAASFGADLIGSVFGESKAQYARIAALGYGGDLFLRKRFMKDSEWAKKNVYLGDDGDPAGGSYVDAVGNTWVETPDGWALAGVGAGDGQLYEDENGNVFQLGAVNQTYGAGFGAFESSSALMGFENSSPLAGNYYDDDVRPSADSSFGYA